ncbi:hypothetical protein HanIR_Chr16g0838791 [Helianthus annuus]|nr:hypothetical protein HanIR_Chr16g0838791 [Helianthus annuus]
MDKWETCFIKTKKKTQHTAVCVRVIARRRKKGVKTLVQQILQIEAQIKPESSA